MCGVKGKMDGRKEGRKEGREGGRKEGETFSFFGKLHRMMFCWGTQVKDVLLKQTTERLSLKQTQVKGHLDIVNVKGHLMKV